MTTDANSSPVLLNSAYRFTSCPYITSLYISGNHSHVCDDCKCLRCVVLRWVRTPNCICRLPEPRQGLSLDARIRIKRLACPHEPKDVPAFPPEFCFCGNRGKPEFLLLLADPSRRNRSDSDEDSYGLDYVEYSSVDSDIESLG